MTAAARADDRRPRPKAPAFSPPCTSALIRRQIRDARIRGSRRHAMQTWALVLRRGCGHKRWSVRERVPRLVGGAADTSAPNHHGRSKTGALYGGEIPSPSSIGGDGGGGGGYFGGGAGGEGGGDSSAGEGAGGSDTVLGGLHATGVVIRDGVRDGDGQVTISWTVSPSATIGAPVGAARYTRGQVVDAVYSVRVAPAAGAWPRVWGRSRRERRLTPQASGRTASHSPRARATASEQARRSATRSCCPQTGVRSPTCTPGPTGGSASRSCSPGRGQQTCWRPPGVDDFAHCAAVLRPAPGRFVFAREHVKGKARDRGT
jgi:hypothetical protein